MPDLPADVSPAPTHETSLDKPAGDLVQRLEQTFRLLAKHLFLPSLRTLRDSTTASDAPIDRASFPLLSLLEAAEDVRPSDAAAALEIDLSTVSRQIRHLEQSGLVVRRPDEDDGRACRVRLTETGQSSLATVRRNRHELLEAAVSTWPAKDRAELLRLLDRLTTGLRELPISPELHAPARSTHAHPIPEMS